MLFKLVMPKLLEPKCASNFLCGSTIIQYSVPTFEQYLRLAHFLSLEIFYQSTRNIYIFMSLFTYIQGFDLSRYSTDKVSQNI